MFKTHKNFYFKFIKLKFKLLNVKNISKNKIDYNLYFNDIKNLEKKMNFNI